MSELIRTWTCRPRFGRGVLSPNCALASFPILIFLYPLHLPPITSTRYLPPTSHPSLLSPPQLPSSFFSFFFPGSPLSQLNTVSYCLPTFNSLMADPQVSPISQLLYTLGITREDLSKRSDQMRQFLTADDGTPSRVIDRDSGYRSRSNSDLPSRFRSSSASSSIPRSISRTSSTSFRDPTPPITPIKSEALENGFPARQYDSMEMVIERQRRQNKKERKSRREKERELTRSTLPNPPSPSPSNASSQPSVSLDSFMQSRDGGRAPAVDDEDNIPPVTTPVRPFLSSRV